MSRPLFEQHCAPFISEVGAAIKIAREAGEIALRFHGKDLDVERKAGNEPVTIADHECSEHIVRRLESEFPDDIIVSEEVSANKARLTAHRVWYVDPIDGTKDFIRGASTYCIMIGLAVDHVPVLGVIYQPNHRTTIFASQGSGAWSQTQSDECKLQCSDIAVPSDARLLTSSVVKSDRIRDCLGIHNADSIGSIGMKMCTIAAGASDIYVNPATHCSSWDTCAPQVILQEAGGKMTNLYGKPLVYDNPETLRHKTGLVATNGRLHPAILQSLASLYPPNSR